VVIQGGLHYIFTLYPKLFFTCLHIIWFKNMYVIPFTYCLKCPRNCHFSPFFRRKYFKNPNIGTCNRAGDSYSNKGVEFDP
jgi:hypothetical protein